MSDTRSSCSTRFLAGRWHARTQHPPLPGSRGLVEAVPSRGLAPYERLVDVDPAYELVRCERRGGGWCLVVRRICGARARAEARKGGTHRHPGIAAGAQQRSKRAHCAPTCCHGACPVGAVRGPGQRQRGTRHLARSLRARAGRARGRAGSGTGTARAARRDRQRRPDPRPSPTPTAPRLD